MEFFMKCFNLVVVLFLTTIISACSSVSNFSLPNLYSSDTTITESIQRSIVANEQFVSAKPISIETHQGHVRLSGYVKTIRQSDVAADIATKTAGVRKVENELIVRK